MSLRVDEEKNPYKPFQDPGVEPKYGRDRGFVVLNTALDVKLDERSKEVSGTATLTVRALHKLASIELDASDMTIASVKMDGRSVRHEHEEPRLSIHASRPLKDGQEAKVAIRYRARPRRGLYFIQPDKHYPKKPVQMWTQGESEDNHHWFPGYDYPNNKATSEARLTVRHPLVAFSNGHLVGSKKAGGWTTYHWKQEVPQPNYLIAVVVGDFDEVTDTWDGVPLHYFVAKGQKEWAKETFKHTPNILGFFSKATGYRYPYPKYAQAVIADFMWGGMENTSMTTVNERFLVLDKHRDDADPDGLVAHEAAHQWFGDLVTTKSWEHIWLNEGFATYFDALWHESFHGADMFQQELVDNADAYMAEDREAYRRPILTRVYQENEDLFDRHTYQKGSLVLHMLRNELGDDLWWKSIRHYVKKFEWKNVETADFKVAIEEATGRNLDWFFDQWIYKAGHPELEASWEHDAKTRLIKLHIKQAQKVVGDTPLFRIPITVWAWSGPGAHKEHQINVSKAEETFFLPAVKRPACVQLDPHGTVLKTLKFERGTKEWAFQLAHAPGVAARVETCRALAKKPGDPEATKALAGALAKDRFWGVRRAAALALGEQATAEARAGLVAARGDKHPRVRRAVARALGNFKRDEAAVSALRSMLRPAEKSDYVIAAALFGIAQTRDKGALKTLQPFLKRDSHNEIIRTSTLLGIAELREPKAVPILTEHTTYGRPPLVRAAATSALGKLWDFLDHKLQDEVRHHLIQLLKDTSQQERRAAYNACAEVADPQVAHALAARLESEPIGLLKKVARDALRQAQQHLGDQSKVADLRKQFEELQREHKRLQAQVATLEARLKAPGKK